MVKRGDVLRGERLHGNPEPSPPQKEEATPPEYEKDILGKGRPEGEIPKQLSRCKGDFRKKTRVKERRVKRCAKTRSNGRAKTNMKKSTYPLRATTLHINRKEGGEEGTSLWTQGIHFRQGKREGKMG